MSRRPLTPEEKEAAAAFRRHLEASDRPQDEIAQEIGVTQGAVWQWADGKIPISAKRAVAAAKAVGADPAEISVAWREARGSGNLSTGLPTTAAHPVRPDFDRMAGAVRLLAEFVRVMSYHPENLFNPRMLEAAYEGVELVGSDMDASNVLDFVAYMNRRIEERRVEVRPREDQEARA
jgi:DNA-binding transcriptional regulator YdaS (Cro superfamily)